jgi:hypothetical protein
MGSEVFGEAKSALTRRGKMRGFLRPELLVRMPLSVPQRLKPHIKGTTLIAALRAAPPKINSNTKI